MQVAQLQHQLAQSETQIRNERDRVRRYAGKVEDLRAKLLHQQSDSDIQNQLFQMQQTYTSIVGVVKDTVTSILGDDVFDTYDIQMYELP